MLSLLQHFECNNWVTTSTLIILHNLIKNLHTLISSHYLHLINLFLQILATIIILFLFFSCKEMEIHRLVLICKATVGFPPTTSLNKWAPVSMHSS
jgi:hypothetical protein